ncbi:hypothetical protein [Dyella agri]|uniref:Uncharacterized protein n=1 Tax=Dyella agri TaxID=1926869 RepID=A0ABW8KNF8_9GAMM
MASGTQTSTPANGDADVAEEIFGDVEATATGLSELLHHLLGSGTHTLADAGLSRFCARRLSAIQSGAEAQALECLHGLQGMAHVLGVALGHPQADLPASVLTDVIWHFHGQLHAIERWRELATNAAGMLDNRRAASDIANRYAAWARSIGEWPDAGP